MKRPPKKDLYAILGVDPNTTEEEIREAYVARARVIHPDRFDPRRQPREWEKANEMLAELNEASSVLRNPDARREYDAFRASRTRTHTPTPPPKRESPQPSPPPFDLGDLSAGCASYANLPRPIQDRLRQRQENQKEDQFQKQLDSIVWNYVFIFILLCWFGLLFVATHGPPWNGNALLGFSGITLSVGFLIGRNLVTLSRWSRSTLKPYFYVTPLYFIRTRYDIISFWPIWMLKDIAVTHRYRNGFYQNSGVILKFDGHHEPLTLSSREEVEALLSQIRTYESRARREFSHGNGDYFRTHDDFLKVPRSTIPTKASLSRGAQILIYSLSVFLCGIGLLIAISVNEAQAQRREVQHPTLTGYTPPPPQRGARPSDLEPPPPSQRVARPSAPQQPLPASGSVRSFTIAEHIAPFEIKATLGDHYLVKLVNAYSGHPVLTVFVRSGSTVNIDVPLGTYEVRYASGDTWYGYGDFFGPDTRYGKANKKFKFEVVGEQVQGYSVMLHKVPHGNLHISPIRPTDF